LSILIIKIELCFSEKVNPINVQAEGGVMNKQVLLERVLGELKTPVFLAGFDSRQSRLTLHVSKGRDLALLNAAARRALNQSGEAIKISVRAHPLRKLAYPRSLEHWLLQFDVDEIIHDPTLVMSRARCLLATAKCCRAALGGAIHGMFFDPDRRTLLVYTRRDKDAAFGQQVRTAVEKAWDQAIPQNVRDKNQRFWTDVQLVAKLPHRDLIPIDAKSVPLALGIRRAIRRWSTPIAVALALAGTAVPAAANVNPLQGVRNQTIGHFASTKGAASHKFGMLGKLSVFGDNAVQLDVDAFASAGLQQYFGERHRAEKGVRVAENVSPNEIRSGHRTGSKHTERRLRRPKEVGQVGGGGGPAGPGS
jgi:hypothetical protein